MKTRVRAIDQTWDVWRWRRVDRYTSRGHGRACPPAPSYNDTARRVPTMVCSDSAKLVSNWRGAIKCRHERARPGNCLISWVRAPIRQPDVTGRRVTARNTVTFNVKWLSKEKLGYISCSRARACLGLYNAWTDRRIYTSLSRSSGFPLKSSARRRHDTRDSGNYPFHPHASRDTIQIAPPPSPSQVYSRLHRKRICASR